MLGGGIPGGMRRMMVCETAVTCAIAAATLALGCRNNRMTATPSKLWLSMRARSSTLLDSEYSLNCVICRSICSAGRPS